jgi:parvulin-like peptidyl-prolyl isomerase
MISEKAVLHVNAEPILGSVLQREMTRLRAEFEATGVPLSLEDRMGLRDNALEILIERALLLQEARRMGFGPTDEQVSQTIDALAPRADGVSGCRAGMDTPELMSEIRRRIMTDRLVEHWQSGVSKPRISEVRDYYRKNRHQFQAPEMVNGAHIVRHLDPDRADDQIRSEVEGLRDRVLQGETFGEVATAHSDCRENGGDLGWFARGLMVDEFDDVVFHATAGQLTPVFRTRFGFHFALIRKRRPAGILDFEEVRNEIEQNLWLGR